MLFFKRNKRSLFFGAEGNDSEQSTFDSSIIKQEQSLTVTTVSLKAQLNDSASLTATVMPRSLQGQKHYILSQSWFCCCEEMLWPWQQLIKKHSIGGCLTVSEASPLLSWQGASQYTGRHSAGEVAESSRRERTEPGMGL